MAANRLRHVAIIMDGNGRWAEQHNLKRAEGHRAGADTVLKVLDGALELGLEYLTLYAFSTENWKRSPAEVSALMNLLQEFLDEKESLFMEKNVRLLTIGRTDGLWPGPRKSLLRVIERTRNNRAGTLILALNYGGRAELADAMKRIAEKVAEGKLKPSAVDEDCITRHLYHPEIPDPDLMIRTSGELRISNFLLWQLAYSELYVTDTLWPDFDVEELKKAAAAFGRRERRFGGRVGEGAGVTCEEKSC